MICPLSPAHLFALACFQLSAILLFFFQPFAPVPLVLFVFVSLLAPIFPGFSYYLPIITRGRKGLKSVALTFDDGPNPAITPRVLELLARHSTKATFFLTGVNAERHPDLVRAILSAGHTIGNHSYSHFPFLMLKGQRSLRQEIESAQKVFKQFGIVPLAFRPPVGITSPNLWRILLELGMYCVNFRCRVGDMGNRRIGNLATKLLKKVRPGDIILLHDGAPPDCDGDRLLKEFEAVLGGLREKGLEVLPLAQLIGKEVMQSEMTAAGANPAELFYDGLAATYDEEQFCSGVSRSRLLEIQLFTSRLPEFFQGADRVLEIGAGTGIFTMMIARHCREVEALDISGKMLVRLSEKCQQEGITNITARMGDVETMALNGPYDVICAFSALEYLKDLPACLQRLSEHLQPGGTVYFITARKSFLRLFTQVGNAMRQGIWLKAHSRGELETMIRGAGLSTISIESHLLKVGPFGGMLHEVVARKPHEPADEAAIRSQECVS